jgi:hypothetical protein
LPYETSVNNYIISKETKKGKGKGRAWDKRKDLIPVAIRISLTRKKYEVNVNLWKETSIFIENSDDD